MNSFLQFIHDDITWCGEEKCPVISCRRNLVNKMSKTGPFSMAMFRGTPECCVSAELDTCMDGCAHAKEVFSQMKDVHEATRHLVDTFCEHCMFASQEED